ncbi:MAG: CHAP domain-containing protein [Candidatus Saccharibacteria bacterium]|nr:CHAP domain-containing protein [Candidatus Saccharibacteria bacterium]
MKKILVSVLIFAMVVTPVFMNAMMVKDVEGLSLACKNSPECMAAVAKEQEANKNAAAASSSANLFQTKVYELSSEIAEKEREIIESEAEAKELSAKIKETEKELAIKQEALAELLINMHFEGDAEPITILAGAESISDLAEKQARESVVKQQISGTAKEIKETKQELEADKVEVERLLAEQQTAKNDLVAKRAEQEALVNKYQNDVASYNAMAEAAKEEQRKAELEEQRKNPSLYSGSSYTGINTYPWQEKCPQDNISYITYWNGYKLGGYVCQCVSYVAWKAYEAYGLAPAWGNASSWDTAASARGYTVNRTPAADTIGQSDSGKYGHVFWVESVNADGSINVTEYNNAYATQNYSGVFRAGDFGSRRISASQVGNFKYIHLR